MITVKVPASSANMGSGFDTLGIALNLYNRVEIDEIPEGLEISAPGFSGYIPSDRSNLIFKAMNTVFDYTDYKPTGIRIAQNSSIPMTRGLGSSSACIIAGMLGANVISGRKLTYKEILNLASKQEGHPDNVAPALYGGFCVSMFNGETTYTKSIRTNSEIKFVAMVPETFMATKKARGVLPDDVPIKDAAFNIAHACMLEAAMISGDWSVLKEAVRDRLHQQYRKVYIDGFDDIVAKTYESGALATYLSGSGQTIMSAVDRNYGGFITAMHEFFKAGQYNRKCLLLSVDNVGAVVKCSQK